MLKNSSVVKHFPLGGSHRVTAVGDVRRDRQRFGVFCSGMVPEALSLSEFPFLTLRQAGHCEEKHSYLSGSPSVHAMGFLSYVLTYIVGGVTFIPLIIVLIWYKSPQVPNSVSERDRKDAIKAERESLEKGEPKGYRDLKAGEFFDKEKLGIKAYHSGWITVTKEFYRFPQINPEEFKQTNTFNSDGDLSNGSAGNALGNNASGGIFSKMMKGGGGGGNGSHSHSNSMDEEFKEGEQDTATLGAAKLKQIRKRNRFYGVIKHGNLFLYSDETQKNVKHAIVLDHYTVAIWPRNLRDGQLFTKRSAICLINTDELAHSKEKAQELLKLLKSKSDNIPPPKNCYFLYADVSIEKEDWYFAFLRATCTNNTLSKLNPNFDPTIMAKPAYYNTADMLDLIETLNATEQQLTTKWINALIGRLFLSTYKTDEFKAAFWLKIEDRLKKIRTPGFLDQLQINRIDVGHSGPFFTDPKLKTLSPEGDLEVLVNVSYQGRAMVEIATKLFVNLGVGFKQRQFDIVMKLIVNKIEGELLLKIKPQPSSRIWYTFSKMPEIDITIEPVFSSRAVSYGIITSIIESRFRDAIKSSLVYPFFDDFVFFRNPEEIFRGGIFDRSCRKSTTNDEDIKMAGDVVKDSISTLPPIAQPISTDPLSNSGEAGIKMEPIKSSNASVISRASSTTSTGASKFSEKDHVISKLSTISSEAEHYNEPTSNSELIEDDVSHTSELKDSVLKSYSRIKHWYKKSPAVPDTSGPAAIGSSATLPRRKTGSIGGKDPNYIPPEMISNRRIKPSKPENLQLDLPSQSDTISSGSSFQLLNSNINTRPSGDAFINLDRKRGTSQSSQFGASSFTEDNPMMLPLNNNNPPSSPEMFINEKFKSPTTATSNSNNSSVMNYAGNKNRVISSPSILRFSNDNDDSLSSPTAASVAALSAGLQESPILQFDGTNDFQKQDTERQQTPNSGEFGAPLSRPRTRLARKPVPPLPPLPPKDNEFSLPKNSSTPI